MHITFPTYGNTRGGITGADRPLCAAVQAWHCATNGGKLGGELKGDLRAASKIQAYLERLGVSRQQLVWWTTGAYLVNYPSIVCDWKLSGYQADALRASCKAGAVYALDCGLGKTPVALAAAIAAARALGVASSATLVVVCPLNAMPVWDSCLSHQDITQVFKNIQVISQDSLHKAVGLSGDVLIVDEAHGMGDAKSYRTKHAHALRARFMSCFCLTGSLLHAGIEKALSIIDLAVPGASEFTTKWDAGRVFGCLVKKPMGQRTVTSLAVPTGANLQKFNEWLAGYVVALAADSAAVAAAFTLPPQEIIDVHMDGWKKPVAQLVLDAAQDICAAKGEWPSMPEVAHYLSAAGIGAKVEWLLEALTNPEDLDRQVVVFYQYTSNGNSIYDALVVAAGISCTRIDGSVTGSERAARIDEFREGRTRVLLAQIDAASVSMNLQNAWTSVQIDPTWKGAAWTQLLARTRRRGQTVDCEHYCLIANKFQARMWQVVKDRADFNSSVADWQEAKAALDTHTPRTP